MADVFISYAREDRGAAEAIASALTPRGISVFFDSQISVGDSWNQRIEEELRNARLIIVVWSSLSTSRTWVNNEARVGMKRDALLPVSIEPCEIPTEFQHLQHAVLEGWHASTGKQILCEFAETVMARLQGRALPQKSVSTPSVKLERSSVVVAKAVELLNRIDERESSFAASLTAIMWAVFAMGAFCVYWLPFGALVSAPAEGGVRVFWGFAGFFLAAALVAGALLVVSGFLAGLLVMPFAAMPKKQAGVDYGEINNAVQSVAVSERASVKDVWRRNQEFASAHGYTCVFDSGNTVLLRLSPTNPKDFSPVPRKFLHIVMWCALLPLLSTWALQGGSILGQQLVNWLQ